MIYSESDLVVPVLKLLLTAGQAGLTTTELIDTLLNELEVEGKDLEILSGRSDTHFSQKVRNLVSHKTLTSKGLTTYSAETRSGRHHITDLGVLYLNNTSEDYNYIMNGGFTEAQRRDVIDKDFKDLIIEEGYLLESSPKQKRKRSRKLTEIARKHYAKDGRISCVGCSFTFNDFYGPTARDYIEIHHLKPIFTYQSKDTAKPLEAALADVRPFCSNCHRMVHRNSNHLLSVKELNDLVKANGKFDVLANSSV